MAVMPVPRRDPHPHSDEGAAALLGQRPRVFCWLVQFAKWALTSVSWGHSSFTPFVSSRASSFAISGRAIPPRLEEAKAGGFTGRRRCRLGKGPKYFGLRTSVDGPVESRT